MGQPTHGHPQASGRACPEPQEGQSASRPTGLTGALLIMALAGCALGGPSGPGPLAGAAADRDSGEICIPISPKGQYALGMDVLANPGGTDALITGLELVERHGLELVDAVVVDINGTAVGARTAWPPPGAENTPEWRAAVPAAGATIPAGSAKQKNLVLHLSAKAGQPATLKAYRVAYAAGRDEVRDADVVHAAHQSQVHLRGKAPERCGRRAVVVPNPRPLTAPRSASHRWTPARSVEGRRTTPRPSARRSRRAATPSHPSRRARCGVALSSSFVRFSAPWVPTCGWVGALHLEHA